MIKMFITKSKVNTSGIMSLFYKTRIQNKTDKKIKQNIGIVKAEYYINMQGNVLI